MHEQGRKSCLKSFGSGVKFLNLCVQFGFIQVAAGFESIVPNVISFQFSAQAFGDDLTDLFQLRWREELGEESFYIFYRYFHFSRKFPFNEIFTGVRIDGFHGVEVIQHTLIAFCRLRGSRCGLSVLGERVGVRIPVVSSGIDDLHWNFLRDNPFHDFINRALLG